MPKTTAKPAQTRATGRTVTVAADGSVTIADAAFLLGYTAQGIRGIVERGCPVERPGQAGRGKGTRVRVDVLHAWLRDESARGTGDEDGGYNYDAARARDMHFRSIAREAEAMQKLGVLIPVDVISDTVEAEYSRVRSALVSIPSRISVRLAALDDPAQVSRELQAELDRAFETLSDGEALTRSVGGDPDRSVHDRLDLEDPDPDGEEPDGA